MKNKSFSIVIFLTIILFTISVFLREIQFSGTKMVWNMDASYHVLLTAKAYDATSWTIHKFLPIVSLGKELDKHTPWGATIPDSKGNFYYTSFGTLGFLLPYLAFKLLAVEPSIQALSRLNFVIHFLSTVAFSLLIWRTLETIAVSQTRRIIATITAAAIYIFSFESLYSHGIIYWHHSPWNLVWICQILCFQTFVVNEKPSFKLKGIYFLLCFISPLLEWTGFLGNIILAILPFLLVELRKKQLYSKVVLAITVLCIGVYLFHFESVVGFDETLTALKYRFEARNAGRGTKEFYSLIQDLFRDYTQSFGLVIWLAIGSLIILRKKLLSQSGLHLKIALIASSFVVLENFLMVQHAVVYTFDRLKVIIPITLLVVALFSALPRKWAGVVLSIVALSLILNINSYTSGERERDIQFVLDDNKRIVQSLSSEIHSCTVLAATSDVRGWMNLYFGRGVYEEILDGEVLKHLTERLNACNGILIKVEKLSVPRGKNCQGYCGQDIIHHFKGFEIYHYKMDKVQSTAH